MKKLVICTVLLSFLNFGGGGGVSSQGNFDSIIQTVRGYYESNVAAGRTGNNWLRVLIALDAESHDSLTPFTAAEAWERVPRWSGWRPVAEALEQFERQSAPIVAPTSLPTSTPMPTSTPLPTNTPTPTSTPIPPTPVPTSTPMPTNTPAPTSTPLPTNTPAPTSTPMPTNTPMPTSTATATPTIQSVQSEPAQAAPLQAEPQAAPQQPDPQGAEPQQEVPTYPDPQQSDVPTWVDGTNCFWWTSADPNDTWKVREFDSFLDWRDNPTNKLFGVPSGGAGNEWVYVNIDGAVRPSVVEFQKSGSGGTGRIVTLFIDLGASHQIKDYMNALGLRPKSESGNSYTSNGTACGDASLYFSIWGNVIPEHMDAVPRTYPPTP